MKLVGLVSSFREGALVQTAVESLRALDHVIVFEGPVEGAQASGPPSWLPPAAGKASVVQGEWASDAAKRTAMLEWAQHRFGGPVWGLWLDGDEVLLWGEYLRDWISRVVEEEADGNEVVGWPISLIELDGSVVWCGAKLVRLDLIEAYLVSSSYLRLKGGTEVGRGNVPAWNPLQGPLQFLEIPVADPSERSGFRVERLPHWRARPPLQGEPHLLHRSLLRSKARQVERQSAAEERNFRGVELPS